jgi:hypothetical protein
MHNSPAGSHELESAGFNGSFVADEIFMVDFAIQKIRDGLYGPLSV